MSNTQVLNGKASEYACVKVFADRLTSLGINIKIITNSSFSLAEKYFTNLPLVTQREMLKAADASFNILARLEPYLENPNNYEPLELSIQEDAQGQKGDVRDILFIRQGAHWSIGISIKHNHEAVKHSRLSDTLNFGLQWFGIPNSQDYFSEISDIFKELRQMKNQNLDWSNIQNKDSRFYVPLLTAFVKELKRLEQENKDIPKKLLEYLLGRHDFYKIIAYPKNQTTQIQAFSMHGTLNQSSGINKPETKIPLLKLPSKFYTVELRDNSTTTAYVICDEGWQISFRIHSASTKVEPSMKFDIKLIGNPTIYTHHEKWSEKL